MVGRLVFGHTALVWVGGWGRQFFLRTALLGASAGLLGQTPPMSLRRLGEVFERLAGDVAFQAAHDLCGAQPLGSPPSHVVAGLVVGCHAGEHDAVERSVCLPVAASVEPHPAGIGVTPHRCAHDRSEASRSGLSPAATSSDAAVSTPTP